MTARQLNVQRLTRTKADGTEETYKFENGVNIISGDNNAGKSYLMATLDFLLGSRRSPDQALGVLARAYNSASLELSIGREPMRLERAWKEVGGKSRIFVNGTAMSTEEFSPFFLDALGLPKLTFPKGAADSVEKWQELSWPTLMRHVFRTDVSWSEIANRQPEGEERAVMMSFFGAGPSVFSQASEKLADQSRELEALESKRAHFEEMLTEIVRGLLSVADVGVGLTRETLNASIDETNASILRREESRDSALRQLRIDAEARLKENVETQKDETVVVLAELHPLRQRLQDLQSDAAKGAARNVELRAYRDTLRAELAKLGRVDRAGSVLSSIRVTNCPACDQEVRSASPDPQTCRVCCQTLPDALIAEDEEGSAGRSRVRFELSQMTEELTEIDQLIERAGRDANEAHRLARDVAESIRQVEQKLRPLQSEAAWIIPPELRQQDHEIGRLQERIRQFQRLVSTLDRRDEFAREVDELTRRIGALNAEAQIKKSEPDFAQLASRLSEAMTDYLNALDGEGKERWGTRTVTAAISATKIRLQVNGKDWRAALGSNLKAFFVVAYQYGLLSLSRTEPFLYPGFAMMDFPADLSDQVKITQSENYLLKPFVDLLARPSLAGTQLIAAGRSFKGLRGTHTIKLIGSHQ